jgi:nucleotide-binding universal stress UspA family protein
MDIGKLQRILVPTDFSDAAEDALGAAMTLARAFGAIIEVLHVNPTTIMVTAPLEAVPFTTLVPDLSRRVKERLNESVARLKQEGIPCETRLMEGSPHLEILKRAEEMNANLIVMGTHGHGGIAHAVLGSVTERVLHRARCPVLVVPVPKAKRSHT